MALPLLSFFGPVVDKVLSFIPDPEQKARARAEIERQIQDSEQSFRDFVVAYEGRGDQVHWGVQVYRSSVRPTMTYAFAFGLAAAIWTNQPVAIIDMLFKLNLLTLAFWFGSRSLEKMGLDLSGLTKGSKK